MGLEIAVTAIRSSNFQFTESQAMGLSLEQVYNSSEEKLSQLEVWGRSSASKLLVTRGKLGLDIIFQIFSESSMLTVLHSLLSDEKH